MRRQNSSCSAGSCRTSSVARLHIEHIGITADVDVPSRPREIQAGAVNAARLEQALRAAGFTPIFVDACGGGRIGPSLALW